MPEVILLELLSYEHCKAVLSLFKDDGLIAAQEHTSFKN
jgi:hypothetical protein